MYDLFRIGDEIGNFDVTVSRFLRHNLPNIEYKVIDRSTFHMQNVNGSGIAGEVKSFAINESTTIGDICTENRGKFVLRMKDGLIQGIVPYNTKAIELIADDYTYRFDRLQSLDHPDEFFICVKFIKDSPADRLQTPLLIKMRNGGRMKTLCLKVLSIVGCTTNLFEAINRFQFFIDGKVVADDHVFIQPNDSNFIQILSLNMNQKKCSSNFSYN